MNDFLLDNDEIMVFVDFNNTLVDFANEYNYISNTFDGDIHRANFAMKSRLSKALSYFEQETGLFPVLCIVTNASMNAIDSNNYMGIAQDLHMTFFDHTNHSATKAKEVFDGSCEKNFRYLIYKENDIFFKINPLAGSTYEMFEPYEFHNKAKQIKYISQFKKKESVERMLSVVDPMHQKMPFSIFAGDSIKDDYPMSLADTSQGTNKFFIRPGRAKKFKPGLIYEFCLAKGVDFSSVHPRTGKKIVCFDNETVKFLNEKDKFAFENFADGTTILLTPENSKGLVEGLYKTADLISGKNYFVQKDEYFN